jgi:arylsulfatase
LGVANDSLIRPLVAVSCHLNMVKTYLQYTPRKLQSYGYTDPITLSDYEKFDWVRKQLEKDGITLHMPTGN